MSATIDSERYLELIRKLCLIPSVSGDAKQENAVADAIAAWLRTVVCAQGNSLSVETPPCIGDRLQRKGVLALLTSPKSNGRTVLLTGHFDVVDTTGSNADLAFDLQRYTEALHSQTLPAPAHRDLESGNWLFGRGAMDMKAGLALFMTAIEALAVSDDLHINIAFLAVPDEESDSAGMRGVMGRFCQFIEENKLHVVAALTGEPCFWTSGANPTRPYYTGSTGKIMPYFLALGKRAHVNDYTEGLNAALMVSQIVRDFEGAEVFIDGRGEETLAPPACLRMQTVTGTYSVSLPDTAYCFFNVLTVSKSPKQVLEDCLSIARQSMLSVVNHANETRNALRSRYASVADDQQPISVLPFEEIREKAVAEFGGIPQYINSLNDFMKALPDSMDARERAIQASLFTVKASHVQGPAMVVGFLPPYYPHRVNRNRNEDEKRLRSVLMQALSEAKVLSGDGAVSFREVFGGISDLSFLGFEGALEELESLRENMPAWGDVYDLPIEALSHLSIPVANMGPAGRDAHMMTERLELDYSIRVAPLLLLRTIERLSA